ncbi:hypothetical protein evm_009917 [Chilo suppressalis]|nr:hypothetical protein evm_009917 [Chilo suppressalis]
MAPRVCDGAIIILDIGKNVSQKEEKDEKSFFIEAREFVSRLIERKILSQGKNLVGLLLLGSKKTHNRMAEECDDAFRHLDMILELQEPTWEMIRNLPETPSKSRGDWIEALIVAADHFKNGISGIKFTSKKIILVTNFMSATCLDGSDIEQVMNGFKEDDFELDVIGPDLSDNSLKGEDIEMAKKFIETTNGATASFKDAMRYLLFHKKKVVNSMPWNVDLSIGPNIKIPVSSYIRLKDEPAVNKWMKAVKDPVTLTSSTTEAIIKNKIHMNTENQTVVNHDAVISGYHYGQQIIPFTECDKSLLYNSGEKCLSLYGFTHSSIISWQNLRGDGLSYVFGRKGDKKAQHTIRCLVECLHEMNLVGLVRRVYNKGCAPKMYALMPVIDNDNYICLSMAEVCYSDEIKYMTFPSTNLKRFECSDEEVNAFKDLIGAMDLTKAYDDTFDDTEAFPIAETVSPAVQYVLDCIAFRAMNPGKPLPKPRDDIMMLFKVPPLVEKRSREPLEKLKNMFTLVKIQKKRKQEVKHTVTEDKTAQNDEKPNGHVLEDKIPLIKLPVANPTLVTKIGTNTPVDDFKTLVDNGKTLTDLSIGMTDAIENLVYCNLDGTYSKALTTMRFFRAECVKADPTPYNDWIIKFKKTLNERKIEDVIALICSNQLDLILKEENNLSTYDNLNSCESQLYENDTVPDGTELTIDQEINDLFDEM